MMGLNLRKLAAVVSAAAMLAVAGPVAVSTANAADAPAAVQTAAQHVTVQFNYGKGRIVPVTLDKGTAFSQFAAKAGTPAAPEGNVFGYWADASKLDDKPVADATPVNDTDFEVYPVFVKAATVTFNGLDAAAGYVKQVTLKSGSTFSQFVDELKKTTSLPTPPEGYELVFSTDQDGKNPVAADEPVTDGLNVFAGFVAKPVETVTVTFYEDESLSSVFKKVEDVEKGKTTFAELAKRVGTPTREGKVFVGWTAAGVDGVINPDSTETFRWDRAFFAVWKDAIVNVTVVFHPDVDNWDQVKNVEKPAGTAFSEFAKTAEAATEVKVPAGKRFVGWTFSETPDKLIDGAEQVNDNGWNVYPAFEDAAPAKVNVAFHQADGSVLANIDGVSGDLFDAFTAKLAARDLAPKVPAGKVFAGWQLEGGVALPELVTGDLDVYPVFKTVYQPQPQFPWWGNWWTAFQHWWGSWNHWFNGWWR